MITDVSNFWLEEKYRPKTIGECILPKIIKDRFLQFVDAKAVPNLILTGPAGCGKTTVARALINEVGGEYLFINSSMYGNIDTLRTTILDFASTVSFDGSRKFVILDEADGMNPNSFQPALRGFMNEMAANCGFIMTANHLRMIIEPLQSRSTVIDFSIMNTTKAREAAAAKFYERLKTILTAENIEFDEKVIIALLNKFVPDFRRVFNEIDGYTQGENRKIDAGILKRTGTAAFAPLFAALRSRNFTTIRTWVGENVDVDVSSVFKTLFDNLAELVKPESAGDFVVILAEYQYKSAFVVDQQINMTACLVEIATNCELT